MSTADAVAREAAWLTQYGDGLPALLAANGGPFDLVQAYDTRTPATMQKTVYVLRTNLRPRRFNQARLISTYSFTLKVNWPLGVSTTSVGIAETEQQNLDNAIELIIQRIHGTVGDHTHGGRFLAVAEAPEPGHIDVRFDDPAQTIPLGYLSASLHYQADDQDFTG